MIFAVFSTLPRPLFRLPRPVEGVRTGYGAENEYPSKVTSTLLPKLKVFSGGQTGADRAALDWALARGIPHGGWCPKGRLASDGPLPAVYLLTETESAGYRQRTRRNVMDADASLIFNRGMLRGGTMQTLRFAQAMRKPHLLVQLDAATATSAAEQIGRWLMAGQFSVVNMAGPGEEKCPGIYAMTLEVLNRLQVRPDAASDTA